MFFVDTGALRDVDRLRIVATVMVLQRIEGAGDREAVDRLAFDLRGKYPAGDLPFDYAGFVHTVSLRRASEDNKSARVACSRAAYKAIWATVSSSRTIGAPFHAYVSDLSRDHRFLARRVSYDLERGGLVSRDDVTRSRPKGLCTRCDETRWPSEGVGRRDDVTKTAAKALRSLRRVTRARRGYLIRSIL